MKIKHPQELDTRIVQEFLLLPRKLPISKEYGSAEITIWLETAQIVQTYDSKYKVWRDWYFLDETEDKANQPV